eukprot:TRINITY_DN8778_c0_g1_i1.p1 TRINITY_DN8778_c0_g1~~TRINITY_DN8778_c0_g1_i1.p1  ORF type:complete len:251 (-),score=63.62 TRINITY_DN8778_c0_g1_i1:14-694(-)
MGAKGSKITLEEALANKPDRITAEQLTQLIEFLKKNNVKGTIDKSKFHSICQGLQETLFHEVDFSPAQSDFVFNVVNTSHQGTIDISELISGLVIICQGSIEEKAKLAFQSFDTNNDKVLSKKELKKQVEKAFILAKKIFVKNLEDLHRSQGLVTSSAITGLAFAAMKPVLIQMVLDDVFDEADMDGDGTISEKEWIDHASSSTNIQMLIDPVSCSDEWKKLFSFE